MQVPVFIAGYIHNDENKYALIWEENNARQTQTDRKKEITRKWLGNKMVYSETVAPRVDDINWKASCSITAEEFIEAKSACKDDGLQVFHFQKYELVGTINGCARR